MQRKIKKVAVLGSGIMGSRIACVFANVGVDVLLLDMPPVELTPEETRKGLSLQSAEVRNRLVTTSFNNALKASPEPLFAPEHARNIRLGNFEDNLKDIHTCDWVVEAVVEKLEIKKSLFEKVDKVRKEGTLITTNTSGIPVHLISEGRSDDFQKHFLGTHFFNPPRYLKLLEIIPGPLTAPEVIDFVMGYGDLILGKTTVLCKDTPAFIANRLGVYALIQTIRIAENLDLTVEEVDRLTGPVIGRPKSGTFRLSDVVGLDTTAFVASNLYKTGADSDESREAFKLPASMSKLLEKQWLGDKSGQGFYKKTKDETGASNILALDLSTMAYRPQVKAKFASLDAARQTDDLIKRLGLLIHGQDKTGEFYRQSFADILQYATFRIPEVSDEFYPFDQAITAGFGWQLGIFETWDAIGFKIMLDVMESLGKKPAPWVYDMAENGFEAFYKIKNGHTLYYDISAKDYRPIPGQGRLIILKNLSDKVVWENAGSVLYDLGDGVVNLAFRSKMNTIGAEVLEGISKSISLAEKDFRALVIGNDSQEAFSAGANLALLFMYGIEQEYDEINLIISQFQKTMMSARYSSIPVVTAPFSLALGGGCEINLHADKVVAHAELYTGLVELGVGLIPAGGGTKEMALRCSDLYQKGDIELNILQNAFMNIAQAKVSSSAMNAKAMHYLTDKDLIVMNRSHLLAEAKKAALEMAENGYVQPIERTDIRVQGKTGMALFLAGIEQMKTARYISEHDGKIAAKLAYVICGGDLSAPQDVSEQYLLDLEREAFLSLSGEKKTLERMQGLLNGGKIPRN